MIHTDFIVRCSGRIEYTRTILSAGILGYILFRIHNWINFPLELAIGIILIISILLILIAFIRAKIQYIEIDEEGMTLHGGLFNKKTTYVPYKRITNIAVHRSIIERVFLLGSLQVDTAGTNQVEINMKNIPAEYLDRIIKSVHKNIKKDDGGV